VNEPQLPRRVVVAGSPNTGKTTLFNRLTGSRARIGNYPGVTVERRSGLLRASTKEGHAPIELVDLPGAYSLCARSPEEMVALSSILGLEDGHRPDAAVVVLDATQLARSLYIGVQLTELDVPCVFALNLVDEAGDRAPDAEALSRTLNAPVVATNARAGTGLDALVETLRESLQSPVEVPNLPVSYPPALLADVEAVLPAIPDSWSGSKRRNQGLALWALNSIGREDELVRVPDRLRSAVQACWEAAANEGRDLDAEISIARYAWLDTLSPPTHDSSRSRTQRVDAVLLHPVWGFALFLLLMLVIFQSLFAWSDPAIGAVEGAFTWLGDLARDLLPASVWTDLVTEGVLSGVGSVLVFLPQILLLFLFIGIMEDSGYMSRAAYLMDRIMRSIGLHGRAFVPMMSGFACAVPAIMATRTMERQRDRLLTMMVVPLMSCSARLPVYTLIIAALFPPSRLYGIFPVQGLLMVSMYLFSTLIALAAAAVLGRTVLRGRQVPFLMELPPYRLPTLGQVLLRMWERSRLFLTEAGSVILVCTILLWGLLSFPKIDPPPPSASAAEVATWQAVSLERSYGGQLGKGIEPVIAPLGFDWKIGVGLIGAFAAREVFVSTMGLVYGVGDGVDEASLPLREHMRREVHADGTPVYTPLMGLSLMVFFALACQCMSTLAVVRRETHSWRWPAFMMAYMTALAWVASFGVFQVGRLLGWG